MKSKSKANRLFAMVSLQNMLRALPHQEYLNYYEFILITRQLNFKFQPADLLEKDIKPFFERNNNRVHKQIITQIIKFMRTEVVNNLKYHIVSINNNIINPEVDKHNRTTVLIDQKLYKKIKAIKAYLQELHGTNWITAFDTEDKGIIKLHEFRWSLRNFAGTFLSESQVNKIFSLFEKDKNGFISKKNFINFLNLNWIYRKLIEKQEAQSNETRYKFHTELIAKQYPIEVYPVKLIGQYERPSLDSKPKTSTNLRYYRPEQTRNKFFNLKQNKQQLLEQSSNDRSQLSVEDSIEKNKFRITQYIGQSKDTQESLGYKPLRQEKFRKRKSTKATILRKQFVDQYIVPRERQLEQERFRSTTLWNRSGQIQGKKVFFK